MRLHEFNTASGKNQLDRVFLPKEELVFGNTTPASAMNPSRQTPPPTP